MINPEWQTWIVKAINLHMSVLLDQTQGEGKVPVIFANQATIKKEKLSRWVEISYFGPFFQGIDADMSATIQVDYRVFIKENKDLYDIDILVGIVSDIGSRSIAVAEFEDRCLTNFGVRVLPKGKVKEPTQPNSMIVQIDYKLQLWE